MVSEQENFQEEADYLERVQRFIETALEKEQDTLSGRKTRLAEARRNMWEETVHFTNDFNRLIEINQHLAELDSQTSGYGQSKKMLERYKRVQSSPYFSRFDFVEGDTDDREKIYIGLANIMEQGTGNILVYDWRAPISSIFYRYELGKAAYEAPAGEISGEVLLKRQYQIVKGHLRSYFDSSVTINDEMLQEVLSRNASQKMRNIVETIQKEQDRIIRDSDNELLIVQGVAGSGKTSVALHRIAYLLYIGMNTKLSSNNILIISPNTTFSKYISNVLPELGEENVEQITFDELAAKFLKERVRTQSRHKQLEYLIANRGSRSAELKRQAMAFKGSGEFITLLDRVISYFERKLIPFSDVYYDGKVIETGQLLKSQFLHNKINMPAARRLERLERILLEKIQPLEKQRLPRIEKVVQASEGHEFDIKPFSRLLAIREMRLLKTAIHKFTRVDYFSLYLKLFSDSGLFHWMAKGLKLPENVEQIRRETAQNLQNGFEGYEDSAPLLYLKLRLEGQEGYADIRQIFVDEAQDYSLLQYKILHLLFGDARFTVLGDVHQSIEKAMEKSFYEEIPGILKKKKATKLFLNKSYRSSYEINRFNQRLLAPEQEFVSFDRHEEEPVLEFMPTLNELNQAVADGISESQAKGFETVAVITKTFHEAQEVYEKLSLKMDIALIRGQDEDIQKGALVIPVYMAKGLEFDSVIVYNAGRDHYQDEYDRRLLYVACTRALHRLAVYYTGEKSPLL